MVNDKAVHLGPWIEAIQLLDEYIEKAGPSSCRYFGENDLCQEHFSVKPCINARTRALVGKLGLPVELDPRLPLGSTWRHKRRGTVYTILMHVTAQDSTVRERDNNIIAIYAAPGEKPWGRDVAEFLDVDGRFERVS